jgi:sugar-specific transcriptional regulator TrmB
MIKSTKKELESKIRALQLEIYTIKQELEASYGMYEDINRENTLLNKIIEDYRKPKEINKITMKTKLTNIYKDLKKLLKDLRKDFNKLDSQYQMIFFVTLNILVGLLCKDLEARTGLNPYLDTLIVASINVLTYFSLKIRKENVV